MGNNSAKTIKNRVNHHFGKERLLKVVLVVTALVVLFVACNVVKIWSTT